MIEAKTTKRSNNGRFKMLFSFDLLIQFLYRTHSFAFIRIGRFSLTTQLSSYPHPAVPLKRTHAHTQKNIDEQAHIRTYIISLPIFCQTCFILSRHFFCWFKIVFYFLFIQTFFSFVTLFDSFYYSHNDFLSLSFLVFSSFFY